MEKGLYKFKILPEIQNFFPAPSQEAQNRLCDSLVDNGCTIPIFVWKKNNDRIIVDGHYRYKICHELEIPFDYEELEFESIDNVKVWRLDMHISTKQLTDFQKCELAFPLEKTISDMVEKRRREAISKTKSNTGISGYRCYKTHEAEKNETGISGYQCSRTADYMAQKLGISSATWNRAKFLIINADEDLKVLLRSGKAKIAPTYRQLFSLIKPKEASEGTADVAEDYECKVGNNGNNGANNGLKDRDNSDEWLPRACSTDGEKAEEPPIEYIAGFKPVIHQEPLEFFPHEPERNPGPFYYVKDYTRSALKNMIKEIKAAIYQLSDEDADKGGEILSMLEQAYNEARTIIEGEIKLHSSHKRN